MSTRASYSFTGHPAGPSHYYVHHDGYPAGAASKLIDALDATPAEHRSDAGALAAAFAATQKAEPCTDPTAYGDLDWRWEVAAADGCLLLTGWRRVWGDTAAEDGWQVAYGPELLRGFLARQAPEIARQQARMAEWQARQGGR